MFILKKFSYIIFFLYFTIFLKVIIACHEGDFLTLNKNHHKWGGGAGILQYTESSTISSFTSSSCDLYTAFLEKNFNSLQEETAQSSGFHLNALAIFWGCPKELFSTFNIQLNQNYSILFNLYTGPQNFKIKVNNIIESNNLLNKNCQFKKI